MASPFLVAMTGLVVQPIHSAAFMVMQPSNTVRTQGAFMGAAAEIPERLAMPEQLTEWGCDAELWNGLPLDAHRDLARFAATSNEEFARNRIATMREIADIAYTSKPGAAWDKAAWEKAVALWEAEKAAEEAAAKQAAKDAKKAAAKAARDAA